NAAHAVLPRRPAACLGGLGLRALGAGHVRPRARVRRQHRARRGGARGLVRAGLRPARAADAGRRARLFGAARRAGVRARGRSRPRTPVRGPGVALAPRRRCPRRGHDRWTPGELGGGRTAHPAAARARGDRTSRAPGRSPAGRVTAMVDQSRATYPVWTLPLSIAVLLVAAVHLAWWLSLRGGHVPACMPYLEGCTSISRAARHGPGNHVFRLMVLPCSALLALH